MDYTIDMNRICMVCGNDLSIQHHSAECTVLVWVNVYEYTRCYGGPEEGGWWFDGYEFLEGIEVLMSETESIRERFLLEYEGCDDINIFIEDMVKESETTERPRYE